MNLNNIMLGSENPKELSEFYGKIFGQPIWSDGDWSGYLVGNGFLSIGPHSEVKDKNKEPARIIMNFEVSDVRGEFERIKSTGAKVIAEPYNPGEAKDAWLATFADSDGNYFQLATPWNEGDK